MSGWPQRGILASLIALSASAGAVGLGPMVRDGATDTDRKGFYLTLINSERRYETYKALAIGFDDERPISDDRVTILPSQVVVPADSTRQLLVVVKDLKPSETFRFRVCSEIANPPPGEMIHARICSKLTARRVAG
jgi:hypothetical protein